MKSRFLLILTAIVFVSCVSPKVYKDLESKYNALQEDHQNLKKSYDDLLAEKNQAQNELNSVLADYEKSQSDQSKLSGELAALKSNYNNLKNSYDALEENSSSALAENAQKNRELLAKLEAKEQALAAESARLETLRRELEERSNRVAELEGVIAAKDAAMTQLKDAISRALTDFEGKGLTIEQRDGKVYVSMENKLLFESGSWAVGASGRQAVKQLGTVLADNPEIAVLIEGHTDNVPYSGGGNLQGNWDLSAKRATAIVQLLMENPRIKPDNLTAAGRGEFLPIASNDSAEGKARNRRIEVILTPKLDEISKILKEI
ncbi:OmpA family protein [Mangrovimonas sp. AS39]|uniref:OmpA/MotB family protein n=1 Tax=Mangrovimonas TaxID=1211036 RepID=UPI001420FE45|nr:MULTISPECIES: OmpA family protein [Mangrovimonas]MCF1190602.1 OmpA family protein [Mangrovimonas futianensis]MCF1193646.1 OmpA family protein [Mangrovimonas futianensis]MCF1420610.1 OmpA family protein [Mangrovimonas futianensis]NIK91152.1 OmpA family protein [Mangrovimonas sp. CR14]